MATTGPLMLLCPPGRLFLILVDVNPEGPGISTVPRPTKEGLNRMAMAKICAVYGQKGAAVHVWA